MSLSDVEICNLCQVKLGAEFIGSIAAPVGAAAKRLAVLYPHYKRVELRSRRWRFALVEKHPLQLLSGVNDGNEYRFRYGKPTNALRVLPENRAIWKVVGNEIHSLGDGRLLIDYIRNDVAEGDFDDHFVEVLACRLAFESCEKTTQSNTKRADMWSGYKEAVRVAGQMNAFIAGPELYGEDDGQYEFLMDRV